MLSLHIKGRAEPLTGVSEAVLWSLWSELTEGCYRKLPIHRDERKHLPGFVGKIFVNTNFSVSRISSEIGEDPLGGIFHSDQVEKKSQR